MLLTSLALAMGLQAQTVIAIKNDDPETWSVEYPRVIRPFVVEYRQCLNLSNRVVTGEANFEAQHRTDLPRCAEVKVASIEGSNAAMEGAKTQLGEQEIDQLFTNIGLIHIARGRDLDEQFKSNAAAVASARDAYFADEKRKALVLEMRDASVVKSRAEVEATGAEAGKVE